MRKDIYEVYGNLGANTSAPNLLTSRLVDFISNITVHRGNILRHQLNSSWKPNTGKVTLLMPDQTDFFNVAKSYPKLKTFIFGEAGDDSNYHIIDNIYEWICDERLYNAVTSPSKWNYPKWYPNGCERNMTRSFIPQNRLSNFYWRNMQDTDLKMDLIHHGSRAHLPTFISVVEDGIVTHLGYVYSHGVKLAHRQCARDESTTVPAFPTTIPFHEEVFVISQYWGEAVFHAIVEDLTRMGPYISFLKKHPIVRQLM